MNTLNQTEMAQVFGGEIVPDIGSGNSGNQNTLTQWAYDQLMRQLQQQAEEAEKRAWQEFMASQAA